MHKRRATPLLRSASILALSSILTAPVLAGRVLQPSPMLLLPGPSAAFCFGVFALAYGS